MLKRIQVKIFLAFSVVGIIAIIAFGGITIDNLQDLALQIPENTRNK